MTLRMETADQFAHRAKITRYQIILATYLTAEERRFVERVWRRNKRLFSNLVRIFRPQVDQTVQHR